MRWLCAVFFTACLAIAAQLALAESLARQDTPASLERAARLSSFAPPARYFERLAELDEPHAARWLTSALTADPRLSSARLNRAFLFERERNFEAARRDLLEAARTDRQYLPAWALANFSFRRGEAAAFWTWARSAAALTYDDFRPLLRLAHEIEPSPSRALDRLGGGDRLARADLDFLIARGRYEDAREVALRILSLHQPQDTPLLLETADRQLRAGRAHDALEIWNGLRPPLDPAAGAVLSNGSLESAPSAVAFDWALPPQHGVTTEWRPHQISFSFAGDQPEECSLLDQTVPLLAHVYRLSFESRGDAVGLHWDLSGQQAASIPPSPDWRAGSVLFRDRAAALHLGRLRLIYRREPGAVRLPGTFQLRNLHMTPEAA